MGTAGLACVSRRLARHHDSHTAKFGWQMQARLRLGRPTLDWEALAFGLLHSSWEAIMLQIGAASLTGLIVLAASLACEGVPSCNLRGVTLIYELQGTATPPKRDDLQRLAGLVKK